MFSFISMSEKCPLQNENEVIAIHIQQKGIDGVNLPLQGEIMYIIKLHCALSAKGYHDSQVF